MELLILFQPKYQVFLSDAFVCSLEMIGVPGYFCAHKEMHNFPPPDGSWAPETFEKHTRESGSLTGRHVDWKKEGIKSVEFLVTPQKECEGCKRLEEKVHVLEEKDRWREFLVVAGEAISRLLSDQLFPCLCETEDPLMEGFECWKDVGKVLRVSKEKHYRAVHSKLERSVRLQDLVYKVVKDKFGMTKEMWDVIQELKDDRNRTYHRRGDPLNVANELCVLLETVEIEETEKLALQKVIEVIKVDDERIVR
jgi:hypothetical protein